MGVSGFYAITFSCCMELLHLNSICQTSNVILSKLSSCLPRCDGSRRISLLLSQCKSNKMNLLDLLVFRRNHVSLGSVTIVIRRGKGHVSIELISLISGKLSMKNLTEDEKEYLEIFLRSTRKLSRSTMNMTEYLLCSEQQLREMRIGKSIFCFSTGRTLYVDYLPKHTANSLGCVVVKCWNC